MLINPSIVLEGTSRAADWIPFAKSMLQSMTVDGMSREAPEAGISITVSRYGDIAKIIIQAEDEDGYHFVGRPYDSLNTSGWGSPYDEENPSGTPGSATNQEVLLENIKGEYSVKRYPLYSGDFPNLEYGNMDWTSADGKTVLTWDGNNNPHSNAFPPARILYGGCCTENQPANNWHKGYTFPGLVVSQRSIDCAPFEYLSQRVLTVDSLEPASYYGESMHSNKIYKDGKVLVELKIGAADVTGIAGADVDVFVFGAAIQKVEDEDGVITQYLVAVYSSLEIDTTGSQRFQESYLYRAPLLDVTNYETTYLSPLYSSDGSQTTDYSPWFFNSKGNEAVCVAQGGANRIRISDQGALVVDVLYAPDAIWPVWENPGFTSPLEIDDIDRWDKDGRTIISVGYKDDVIQYGVEYLVAWHERGITNEDPATGCDTLTSLQEYGEKKWFAFTDAPEVMNSITTGAKPVADAYTYFSFANEGGTNGTAADPARLHTTHKEREIFHPLYTDSRYSIIVYERTVMPANTLLFGQNVLGSAFLMEPLADAATYNYEVSLEVYIEGVLVYETHPVVLIKRAGDCRELSVYGSFPDQFPCNQVGTQLYLAGNPDRQGAIYEEPYLVEAHNPVFFCNVQIHKSNSAEPNFDILFTARTKYTEGLPTVSFAATWDGSELIDIIDVPELLGIREDGVFVNTGKI